jgi:hypothetical protein
VERPTQKAQIQDFVRKNPGKTAAEIASATGIRVTNVSAVLVKGFYAGWCRREKPVDRGWVYFVVV